MKSNAPKNSNQAVLWMIALVLAASFAAFFASRNSQTKPPQIHYVLGEIATNEMVAPKKITVVDPVETEAKREAELLKIPAMFRFKQSAAEEAVAGFNADFLSSRKSFLDAVEKSFKKRTLSTNQAIGPRFRTVFTTFKAKHKTFPATIGQALKWAQGNSQEELQTQFRERLRASAGKFIRSDALHPLARSDSIRFINEEVRVSGADLLKRSQPLRRTNLIGLSKARNELAASFRENERIVSDVLTNYLQVNCVFDEQLTQQIRAERTNSIWAFVTYEAGDVIVQRGQVIDAKTKAALDQTGGIASGAKPVSRKQIWLWAAAISCAALALLVGLRSLFVRRDTALVPVGNLLVLPMSENGNESLQTKLMPHLAQGLMNKLVRGLISQRAELIESQTAGSEQLNQLEQRLEQINTRLQTRQSVYEQRIAELEKELTAAEEENRELIRSKIREARENLELARAQNT